MIRQQQDPPHDINPQIWQDALPAMMWASKAHTTPYIFCAPVRVPVRLSQLAADVRDYICRSLPSAYDVQTSLFITSPSSAIQPLDTSAGEITHLYALVLLNSALSPVDEAQVQREVRRRCVDWSSCASDVSAFAPGTILFETIKRHFSSCLDAVCAINVPVSDSPTAFQALSFREY